MVVLLHLIETEKEFSGRLGNCNLENTLQILKKEDELF